MNKRQRKVRTIVAACLLILAFIGAIVGTAHGQTNDEKHAQAVKLLNEGFNLFQSGTAESLQAALPKLEQAQKILHEIDDKTLEADSLLKLGLVYYKLGEKPKALVYFLQSLPLYRIVGGKLGEMMTLNNIGKVYDDLGEKQKAIDYYAQGLPLFKLVNDKGSEAYTLDQIGTLYSILGENQKALDHFLQSLPLYRLAPNKTDEAITLNNIGKVYSDLGEYQQALKFLNESLPLLRATGNKRTEASALNNIGTVYIDLGDYQQALKFLNESLLLRLALSDKSGEAATLSNIGEVYHNLGEQQQALKFYNESLPLFQAADDKSGKARTLGKIAAVYSALGEKQQALKFYQETLLLFQAAGDKIGEAITLTNIAGVYSDLGEKQQTLKFYKESLLLYRAISDKRGEGTTLTNIGSVYDALGDKQQALKFYNESLPLLLATGNKNREASTLNNIGSVYNELGDKQQALKFYNESARISRAIKDKQGEAATLNNIGGVYSDLGGKQQALKFYEEALPLFRALSDKGGEATMLSNIGLVYQHLGDKQQALKYYNESLSLTRAVGDKRGEGTTLTNIGSVYDALGDKQQALKFFNESLLSRRAVGDRSGEANTLYYLFSSFSSSNPRFAVFYGKQSVNNYQILRSNVQGLDKNLQQTFLKSIEGGYRFLTDELVKQQRFAEAQQLLNNFKDQQFFDFSQSKKFVPLAVTVREAELTNTFNQKLENVAAAIRALDKYKRGIGERAATAAETAQLKSLEDKQTAANADYLAFLKSAEKEFAAPPTDKDKFPDVPDLAQLQTTLRELSAQTGEKSVAVYTLVGVDNYRALVVAPDSISAVSTPIKGAVLNEKAQQLWWFLHQSKYDPQPLAKEVYDAVFAPLAGKLPADTKTILWSLDGSLRYVPMAALHDGKQYLVERYNNVVFTRADRERLTRSVSANLTGTGFGSSRRHIVKLGGESIEFPPLVYVEPELARIFKNGGSTTGVVTGETMLDAQFTRATMISTLKKRRPLVHIASHFKFAPGDEANSFLLLGDGTAFTLDEMKRQKDLFAGVELLALSACETAAQQEDSNGREVDGFAELAQRLGAGAVMASLWAVRDDSTAELMARFYKNYNGQKGANKASALRSAQLALLSGEYKTAGAANRQLMQEDKETAEKFKIDLTKQKLFDNAKNPKFAHPYFWSPFILIGNWK